ncbi:hypothetical protein GUITHDRAFT_116317 [Guillardia theta CCMP2712]|uniref:Uncharacterized protein n=2 Tax=Guillardia theta TaxID=55529 RepID=L1IMK8_GUITC|nr:hypothetical protein GUITHDRAFT_116317 [Guillardia theta CCMP2712]EKX37508.1 hypothetical protein GUITHDRAFT_116317 [Guillardia theta CCMP2712]|eukprot:XP_005824488.1 hypothetical protein GUITHDRAFT_116317 [Guillardia theta CCMP2712]
MAQISDEMSCNLALKMLYDMFNKTRHLKNMCGLILDLIATIYIQQRDLESSLRCVFERMDLFQSPLLVDSLLSYTQRDIAGIYRSLGRWEECISFLNKSLQSLNDREKESFMSERRRTFINIELASSMLRCGRLQDAISVAEHSMKTMGVLTSHETRQEWKLFCKIVEECSSKLVSQALSGLTMKEWIDKEEAREKLEEEKAEERRREQEAIARQAKLDEFAARGGKIITNKLDDGTNVTILIEGSTVQQDWEKTMNDISEVRMLRMKQRKIEGERCFEGAKAAIRQHPPAVEQARFLFERARDAFATAAVFDMITPLRKMQDKLELLEKKECGKVVVPTQIKMPAASEEERDNYVAEDEDDAYGADEQDEDVDEKATCSQATLIETSNATDWESWWKKDMSRVNEESLLAKQVQEIQENGREKGEEGEMDDETRSRKKKVEEMIRKELEEQRVAYLKRLQEKNVEDEEEGDDERYRGSDDDNDVT